MVIIIDDDNDDDVMSSLLYIVGTHWSSAPNSLYWQRTSPDIKNLSLLLKFV